MRNATQNEINVFKEQYCSSEIDRDKIKDNFNITIESYEELLPGDSVKSYATGNRMIDGSFIIFSVVDELDGITYNPIFSDTVARKVAKGAGLQIPVKMSVFTDNSEGVSRSDTKVANSNKNKRKNDNKQMLLLIQFARSMMILNQKEPQPMNGVFKKIYDTLLCKPYYNVFESDIKSINTSLKNYIARETNFKNENFENLQQYINYLQRTYPNKRIKNCEFEILRQKMHEKYPDEKIYF